MISAFAELRSPYFAKLIDDICLVGGPKLTSCLKTLKRASDKVDNLSSFLESILPVTTNHKDLVSDTCLRFDLLSEESTLRRITTVHAPGGKTRIVAIVDYFTQSA